MAASSRSNTFFSLYLVQVGLALELAAIAELTGEGVEPVKSRLRYALAKLRAQLGDLSGDFQ